jgi:hypothetical protein
LSNQSSEDVEVERLAASCGCVSIDPVHFVVRSRETVPVTLRLYALPASLDGKSHDLEVKKASFRTKASAQGKSVWLLHGVIQSPIAPTTPDLKLSIDYANPDDPGWYIPFKARVPLQSIEALAANSSIAATVERVDSTQFKLHVIPTVRLPSGRSHVVVHLAPRTIEGTLLPSLPITIQILVKSRMRIVPSALSLGICDLNSVVTGEFVLESNNDLPLPRFDIVGSPESLVVRENLPISTEAKRAYVVQVPIVGEGMQECQVSIRQLDGGIDVVPITYVGVVP